MWFLSFWFRFRVRCSKMQKPWFEQVSVPERDWISWHRNELPTTNPADHTGDELWVAYITRLTARTLLITGHYQSDIRHCLTQRHLTNVIEVMKNHVRGWIRVKPLSIYTGSNDIEAKPTQDRLLIYKKPSFSGLPHTYSLKHACYATRTSQRQTPLV